LTAQAGTAVSNRYSWAMARPGKKKSAATKSGRMKRVPGIFESFMRIPLLNRLLLHCNRFKPVDKHF
jgi:hypothetical protein